MFFFFWPCSDSVDPIRHWSGPVKSGATCFVTYLHNPGRKNLFTENIFQTLDKKPIKGYCHRRFRRRPGCSSSSWIFRQRPLCHTSPVIIWPHIWINTYIIYIYDRFVYLFMSLQLILRWKVLMKSFNSKHVQHGLDFQILGIQVPTRHCIRICSSNIKISGSNTEMCTDVMIPPAGQMCTANNSCLPSVFGREHLVVVLWRQTRT